METKQNCWEFMNCGRETGGAKVGELGVCPVYTATEFNGINGGINGGRFCWKIAGSFCGGKVQGTWAEKQGTCLACKFSQKVLKEEGKSARLL